MESKKINQLATEMAPVASDLTIIGDPITGVSKKITLEQLAVLFGGAISFYSSYASFPATGDVDIIYCAKDTNKLYLWNGAYVEIFPSQALLDTYQLRSEKGNANGYASLDSLGKVPVSQLPSSLMEYKGTWNASTNTPTLANGTGDTGDVYICSVAGTVNFGAGAITFAVGDYVIYSGSIWQRSSGATGTVTSVAVTESGDALTITGSPITTSGTINIGFAGTSAQYVAGNGSLVTFPSIITEAQKLVTEVYNSTGATLTKGTVVYINGGQGNLPTITKAIATGDSTSAQTYGVVQSDITNMNNGYVVAMGALSNLDTQAYSVGTQLYLSATTAGAWTSTKQYAPNHLVYVGIVVRSHPTQGVVEIRIQNGFELDELHNVSAQTPSNNHGIFYNSSTSLWENKSIATVLGYTPISLASLSASSPLSYNNTTGAFSISQASGSADGYLSSTDWTTFNSKQDALTNPITGTGVSGRIAYFNGTTTQTSSANLTWDATNNRVGIGLTNPQRSLEIYNATADSHLRLSGAAPTVSMGEAITGAVYQAKFGLITSNGQFVTGGLAGDFVIISQTGATIWATSGGEKMRLTSGGNLGIGTTSPTFTLQVSGTTRISGQLSLGSTITNATYTYTLPGATGTLALSSDLSSYLPLSGGTLTGALNGTSASFSSSVTANSLSTPSTGATGSTTWNFYHDQYAAGDFSLWAGSTTRILINAAGNVGIGTTTPGAALNVSGINVAAAIDWTNTTATTGRTYRWVSTNGGAFAIEDITSGGERMRITSGGNVLVSTTTSNNAVFKLQVGNGSSDARALFNSNNAYSISVGNGASSLWYIGVNAQTASNGLQFYSNELGNSVMTVATSGYVGIGTSSPNNKLEIINGVLGVSTNQTGEGILYGRIAMYSTGAGNAYINYGGEIRSYSGAGIDQSDLRFYTSPNAGATERMRITSGGDVCINATTSGGYKFYVNGSAAFGSVFVGSLGTGTVYSSSGTLTNTNPSDKRLKDNITPIAYGLNEVLQLNPVSFDWKNDNNKNKQFGFIAQEVQEVMPEAVIEGEYLGLEKDAIYTALVNAIKELKKEIDELKNK